MAKFNCNSTCGFVNPELQMFTLVVVTWLHDLVTVDWSYANCSERDISDLLF